MNFVDAPSFLFMRGEIFESEIYRFQCSKQNPYIIDCGANIGLSVIYFKKLFPDSLILAFEPDENIFNILCKNMVTFDLQGITLSNKALWGMESCVPFYMEGADGGRIDSAKPSQTSFYVDATTLGQYLEKPVDFLKLDIEGAEYNVLEECKNGLVNVERIFLEYHSTHDEPQRLGRILEILTEAGFRYYVEHIGVTSKHPFIRSHTYNNFDNQLNIYAYRR